MKPKVPTHHYQPDTEPPPNQRCAAPGLRGRVCGLPEINQHHLVPAVDPVFTAVEARRLGERQEASP